MCFKMNEFKNKFIHLFLKQDTRILTAVAVGCAVKLVVQQHQQCDSEPCSLYVNCVFATKEACVTNCKIGLESD